MDTLPLYAPLRDLPVAEHPVRLRLQVRRFHCATPTCPRQTFTERLQPSPPATQEQQARHAARVPHYEQSRPALPKASPSGRFLQRVALVSRPPATGSGARVSHSIRGALGRPQRLMRISHTSGRAWRRAARIIPACGARSGCGAIQARAHSSPSGSAPIMAGPGTPPPAAPRCQRPVNSPGSS